MYVLSASFLHECCISYSSSKLKGSEQVNSKIIKKIIKRLLVDKIIINTNFEFPHSSSICGTFLRALFHMAQELLFSQSKL